MYDMRANLGLEVWIEIEPTTNRIVDIAEAVCVGLAKHGGTVVLHEHL